jgi:hypothetical protein
VLATGFATDFYSSEAEAAAEAEAKAAKAAAAAAGPIKKNAPPSKLSPAPVAAAPAGPTRQKLPSSLKTPPPPATPVTPSRRVVAETSAPRAAPRRGSEEETEELEGEEEEEEYAEDDDGYIEPSQRGRMTVGSVGGGAAIGRGGKSPIMGPRGYDARAGNSKRNQGKDESNQKDSNRYKGIRGFLRKLFE